MKRWLGPDRTFVAIVLVGIFAMAARNVVDPDVWWHLKTGQYIAEHKSVPDSDPFSFTRAGQPWVAHEWLTDLFLYETMRLAGWGGLIVIFAAIVSATFYFLFLRCASPPYIACVAAVFAAWTTMPLWGVRPQILSLLLTSLWLLILERSEINPRLLWWTLPLTLLWVNLHAGFALGLVLLGLFIAGGLLEFRFAKLQSKRAWLRTAGLVLPIDLLVVPLNPNGLRMFCYPIETLQSAGMQRYIAEWASPNFHHAEYWPFLLLILVTFATLCWSAKAARSRDILLLIVSLYAGLVSIRLIPLFVLIAVPIVAERIVSNQIAGWPRTHRTIRKDTSLRTLLNGCIVLAMLIFALTRTAGTIHNQPEAEMRHFPVRAVAFLKAHGGDGRLFNHYDWGGYLIWKLYPPTQVFVDGRADLYAAPNVGASADDHGEPLLDQFAHTYQFQDRWERALEQWRIRTVIVPANSALATGLRSAPGWVVSYEDSQAIVLARVAAEHD